MRPSIKNKKLFGRLLAAGFFIFVGAVFVFILWEQHAMEQASRAYKEAQIERYRRQTAETTGIITNYEERQMEKFYSRSVTYQYVVNGKPYSKSNGAPIGTYETHRKGAEGKVCYDPAEPENAFFSLKQENVICGE